MTKKTNTISLVEHREALNHYVENSDKEGLRDIAEKILNCTQIIGSSDDFYDFGIGLARLNDYEMACRIFERGLDVYTSSVDLLAGYILYGIDCDGNRTKCESCYKMLRAIPDERWTWRGYSFSLQYLYTLLQMTNPNDVERLKELNEEMVALIDLFRKKSPKDERIYIAEARLYSTSEPEREFNTLEVAVQNLSICPRCAYQYAVLLINRANSSDDYRKALGALKKALKLSTDADNINFKNVYFLQGLCLKELLSDEDYKNKEKIKEIYECFNVAQIDTDDGVVLSNNFHKMLKQQISILYKLTNISWENE